MSSKALELKQLCINQNEINELNNLKDLYGKVKAKINAYLKVVITDAADYTVDEDEDSYKRREVAALVKKFETGVNSLRERKTISENINIFTGISRGIIDGILMIADFALKKEKEKREEFREIQKEAYERFKNYVEKNFMKDYESLNQNSYDLTLPSSE